MAVKRVDNRFGRLDGQVGGRMHRRVGGWMTGCVSEGASASGLCWQGVCGDTHETKRHSSGKITVRRTDRLCSEHCHEREGERECLWVCVGVRLSGSM